MSDVINEIGRAVEDSAPVDVLSHTVRSFDIHDDASISLPEQPSLPDPRFLARFDAAGHALIPLHHPNTLGAKGQPLGKSPINRGWPKMRAMSPAEAIAHMASGCNVGVRLRPTDLVIDADPRNYTENDPLTRLCREFVLPDCPTVETGSGGRHLYLRKPAGVRILTRMPGYDGLEFKTVGTQVVAPGSVHPETGRLYLFDPLFDDPALAPDVPAALLNALTRPERNSASVDPGETSPELLARMLELLRPEKFKDYEGWLRLAMSCHHATGGCGEDEFVAWSVRDPDYSDHEESIRHHWASFNCKRSGGVTARWLYKLLNEAGGGSLVDEALRSTPEEDFADEPELPAVVEPKLPAFVRNNGRVSNTLRNSMTALRLGKLGLAFDELAQRPVLRSDALPWSADVGRELNEDVIRVLRHWILEAFGWEASKENVTEAAMTLAFESRFNPVRQYLDDLAWDGDSRLDSLLPRYFGAQDGEYERAVGRKLLLAAARRAREPGCKFDLVPILEGAQGSGKTSALRILGGAWHSDAELGSVEKKDAPIVLQGVWIMELGELSAMNKSGVDHLKAFVSRTDDRYRPPFERLAKTFPRRCVFVGTTNSCAYLRDLTGNRRFLPVRTGKIDLAGLRLDRDQLWAEAVAMEKAGEPLELPRGLWKLASDHQAERTVEDPWTIKIREHLAEHSAITRISSTELLDHVLGVPSGRQNQLEAKRLRQAMELIGWAYRRAVRIEDNVTTGYVSPSDAVGA